MSYYVDRTDGRGNTTTTAYDSFGQAVSVTDAAGAVTRYAYDPLGQLVAVTNALGNATEYAYDVRGNKVYEGGATYPVTYAYDLFNVMTNMTTYRTQASELSNVSNVSMVSNVSAEATAWLYDAASGVLLQKLYADGHGPSYTYTADGKLATRTWARGVVTAYAYDGWGNLTNTAYGDGTPSVVLAYDAMGRQIRAPDAAGITAFAYDQSGQNTTESASLASIAHRYDAFGRDIGYSHSSGSGTLLSYDPVSGRLASAAFDGNIFAYHYLPGTDLQSVLSAPGFDKVISYEPSRDLVTGIAYTNSALIAARIYGYDILGNVTNRVQRRGTDLREDVFANDVRQQLTNAVLGSASYAYAFDDIGNRSSANETNVLTAYAANNLNQYTNILSGLVPFSPIFDLDGNQTLIRTSTGIWRVIYNGENRPVSWTCGVTNIAMAFDRMGRRVVCDTFVSGSLAESKRFSYDGYLLVQESNLATSNQPQTTSQSYFWDPSEPVATRPLAMKDADGNLKYDTVDLTKNVCELLNASGAVETTYDYTPFGAVTASGAASPNRFQWSSEYNDAELGLVYYNYRHYNLMDGRWINRDPMGKKRENHLYRFVVNSPDLSMDILGLWATDVHKDRTIQWAQLDGMPAVGAELIGKFDDQVDSDFDPTTITDSNWSWHFNRAVEGAEDTRLRHSSEEFDAAKKACTWEFEQKDDWKDAALHMGRALHPLQDWVAHGDFNRRQEMPNIEHYPLMSILYYIHNYSAPESGSTKFPDSVDLDSTGLDGRPTMDVMKYQGTLRNGDRYFSAPFSSGTLRIRLTERRTRDLLRSFRNHVRAKGRPCGMCRRAFLGPADSSDNGQ